MKTIKDFFKQYVKVVKDDFSTEEIQMFDILWNSYNNFKYLTEKQGCKDFEQYLKNAFDLYCAERNYPKKDIEVQPDDNTDVYMEISASKEHTTLFYNMPILDFGLKHKSPLNMLVILTNMFHEFGHFSDMTENEVVDCGYVAYGYIMKKDEFWYDSDFIIPKQKKHPLAKPMKLAQKRLMAKVAFERKKLDVFDYLYDKNKSEYYANCNELFYCKRMTDYLKLSKKITDDEAKEMERFIKELALQQIKRIMHFAPAYERCRIILNKNSKMICEDVMGKNSIENPDKFAKKINELLKYE